MNLLEMRLDDLYTPQAEIVPELERRQRLLKPRAASCPLEERLLASRHAVILRNVLTPNFEIVRFVSMAAAMGLRPLVLEFHADKFVIINPAKAPLALMRFSPAAGAERAACQTVRLVDVDRFQSRPFHEITTLGGESLIEFHHQLVNETALGGKIDCCDASGWVLAQGKRAEGYYEALFRLFIAHAVLFESYLNKGRDRAFTERIVFPAFAEVAAQNGMKPLICRLDPPESEGCETWYHYPAALYPKVAGIAVEWAARGNRVLGPKTGVLMRRIDQTLQPKDR